MLCASALAAQVKCAVGALSYQMRKFFGIVIAWMALMGLSSAQLSYHDEQKAIIHDAAAAKRAQGAHHDATAGLGALSGTPSSKCCTVAMFLSTTDLPSTGDAADIARSAISCCRDMICGKFYTEDGCEWISSGDATWKADLSSDLDHLQEIDERLQQLAADDLDDPDAKSEKNALLAERQMVEEKEIKRVQKSLMEDRQMGLYDDDTEDGSNPANARVAPLTATCDLAMDPEALGTGSIKEQQEARITCVSLLVSLAADACAWQPEERVCRRVTPTPSITDYFPSWSTITIILVIGAILGATYYVAKPPLDGSDSGVRRGEYSALDQLPSDLAGGGARR